ncbi:hypothetical protein BpHYR1_050372 [Brachionus plicatilis]|uniref:Uncharacterized protein n=1 Tax=Brachionus plicatilis TaxID=10195 RepID=A0A3M7SUZ4_BRAPC|nr:hypothetical protein BpHYR1_050372 [Brachionus plicatilis]
MCREQKLKGLRFLCLVRPLTDHFGLDDPLSAKSSLSLEEPPQMTTKFLPYLICPVHGISCNLIVLNKFDKAKPCRIGNKKIFFVPSHKSKLRGSRVIIVCWGLNLFREIIDEIITMNPTKGLPKPEIYKN